MDFQSQPPLDSQAMFNSRKKAIGHRLLEILPLTSLCLSFIYLLFIFFDGFLYPKSILIHLILIDVLFMFIMAGLYLLLKKAPPSPEWTHVIGVCIGLLVLLNGFPSFVMLDDPKQTAYLLLIILVASCLMLSYAAFLFFVLCTVISWLCIAMLSEMPSEWLHFGFMLVLSSVAGVIILHFRIRAFDREYQKIRELEVTRKQLETRTRELEDATEELSMQIAEREQAQNLLRQFVHNSPAPIAMFDRDMH
ncbi:hypothetical protein K8I31_15245, partial [bacterium]|nr:hypothetical protein [bacterium]